MDIKFLEQTSIALVSSGHHYDFLPNDNILSNINDNYIRFSLPALQSWPQCPYPIASVLELLGPRYSSRYISPLTYDSVMLDLIYHAWSEHKILLHSAQPKNLTVSRDNMLLTAGDACDR